MKRTFKILIPVLLIVAGLSGWLITRKSNGVAPYRLSVVDRGTVQVVVTATGTASAVTTVTVGSQVSGTLKEIYVDFNSPVKKGDLLAKLDPTFLQAAVSEAEANLEKARATENQAKRDLTRVTELSAKNLVAQVELDNATTALETAKASVRQTEAALERAKVNLRYSIITSPIDGVVISRNVDVGQTVAASLQAPTLFTIAQDLSQMQIETDIDEADIGRLEEGKEATFTVDSYPEETFRGRIHQIRYAAKTDQGVVTYPVILLVENPELKLRPGMTANVSVVISRRTDVPRMPAAALRFRPADYKPERGPRSEGTATRRDTTAGNPQKRGDSTMTVQKPQENRNSSAATVFVKGADGKAQPIKVSVGLNDGSFAEITGTELSPGDSVIVGLSGKTSSQSNSLPPGMGGGPRR